MNKKQLYIGSCIALMSMLMSACGGTHDGKDGQDGKDGTDGTNSVGSTTGTAGTPGEDGTPSVFPQPEITHHDNGNHYGHDKK